ncbi:MAG: methyltransferase domain-containing protein [Bacteroidia bacterium]
MAKEKAVESYYDEWVDGQIKIGVNLRHLEIFHALKKQGLKPTDDVLEIGCGIGAVSSLLVPYLRRGSLLGIDISPKSIEVANKRFSTSSNAKFAVSDMSDFEATAAYDVIVLPDVLEHIPVAQHPDLFRRLKAAIRPGGFIFIHIPYPRFLAWQHIHQPDNLQIIDQALSTDTLLRDAYAAGFYLEQLASYSIFHDQPDYQRIVLMPEQDFPRPALQNKYLRIFRKYRLKFFG